MVAGGGRLAAAKEGPMTAVSPSQPPDPTAAALDAADWLDAHFAACRPEYEAMLRSVGIAAGWRVLDAGCGGGCHLPLLAELVGPRGRIDALDLSADNVAAVRVRLDAWGPPCPIGARQGTLTALPYPDNAFDAAWCANVVQHLDDDALAAALAELRRVVRPGGLVAVKDVDMALWRLAPADPTLIAGLALASLRRGGTAARETRGSLRGRTLGRWLERAGLTDVRQQTTLIERWAPLRPVERALWADWLRHLAAAAEARVADPDALAAWRAVADPDRPGHPLDAPDAYTCEGQVVAVGTVPRPAA
jgi:SAM-dependent methyltransferase